MKSSLVKSLAGTEQYVGALVKTLKGGRVLGLIGPLGAGKTTIVQAIKDNWEELSNRPADSLVVAKEPGGTLLGDKLRELLLDIQDMEELYPTKAAEMCMFSAARCQLMTTVVGPALAEGKDE